MAAVRKVERLVDEREVRDDVADNGMFEDRPILPRRIVRMAAADRALRAALEREKHRPAPALDRAECETEARDLGQRKLDETRGQRGDEQIDEAQRFHYFVKARRDARGDVAVAMDDASHLQRVIRWYGRVAAQVAGKTAGARRKAREPQLGRELARDNAARTEAILQARVLVVDVAENAQLAT